MKNNLFIKILISVFITYSLIGFFLVPYVVKTQVIKNLDNLLVYKSTLKDVSFNPYTLNLKLDNFGISNKEQNLISFEQLEIEFSLFKSIHESHINFKTLNIVKPYVDVIQDEKGEINLFSLLKPQDESIEKEVKEEESTIPSFKISKTQIINGNFLFTQIFNSKKTTTDINGFNYTFYDIGTHKNSLASHSLVTKINKNTKLQIDGAFRLIPFKVYGKLNLINLNPKEYLGYSRDLLNFDINEPSLNLTLGYRVDTTDGLKLNIDKANISLDDLKLLRKDKELIGLNRFKINDLSLDLTDKKIDVNEITLNALFANIDLYKDGKLNIDNLVNIENSKDEIKDTEKQKEDIPWSVELNSFVLDKSNLSYNDMKNRTKLNAKDISISLDKLTVLNNDIKIIKSTIGTKELKINDKINKTDIKANNIEINLHDLLKDDKKIKLSSIDMNNPIASIILGKKEIKKDDNIEKKKVTKEDKNDSSMALDIGPLKINNAKLTFQDKNLQVPFKTDITKLNGSFSELNTKSSKPTKLKLEGKIDKYGYTRITGFVDQKNIKNLTDVTLIFKNIAIKNFTPYSGKFAGRELKKGKLNLNLKYNISKSNLNAQNSVIITDIELGKVVESPEAMNLPLELGIALLEDSDGIINIDLPITGNLDDPQFSIAPIVWKVFTNLIIKAVTSPFSFLASLLGISEDDIKSVEFIYGESELIASEKETLDNIAKAFAKRPNLALKVEPAYDAIKDKKAIQNLKFENQLLEEMKKFKDGDKYLLALESKYNQSKEELAIKELKKEFIVEKDGKKILDKESYIAKIKAILTPKIVVTNEELKALALKRVVSIKEYLLSKHKIGDKRLFINKEIKTLDNKDAKYAEFALAIDIKKK